ncbi:MAG: serine/threonine protein kinase [Acidimicrobiales bacterium]|nr:serine/threonine protein kinase [Acidimicrobiales bacterium]
MPAGGASSPVDQAPASPAPTAPPAESAHTERVPVASSHADGAPPKPVTPQAEDAALRVGPVDDPDRYKLFSRVSKGNDGDIWKAALPIDDVDLPVAIKISWGVEGDLDEHREKWLKQAEILRSLEHPALMKVREVFESAEPHAPGEAGTPKCICMAMNWVDGIPLDQWVKAHPDRTLDDLLRVLGPVASGLEYLHTGIAGRSVLHRNVKPANVLVSEDGTVRLVGFGTARLMKLDAQMTIVGTPAWMPPEILNGQTYDSAADRWGFGAVVFYLVTGSPPPLLNVDKARTMLQEAPLMARNDALIDHVISLLAIEPQSRPESTITWLQEFHSLIKSGGSQGSS